MTEVARELVESGCTRWCLNVSRDNAAALGLYAKFGLSEQHATSVVRLRWACIGALAPAPHAAVGRTLTAKEDRSVEQQFALTPGLLEARRGRPDTIILPALADNQLHQAVAVFDANFPGAA